VNTNPGSALRSRRPSLGAVNIDRLVKLIGECPAVGFAQVAPGVRGQMAIDALKQRGVNLQGGNWVESLIIETERQAKLLRRTDDNHEQILRKRPGGRPNTPSLSDVLIYTLHNALQFKTPLKNRPARKRTAQICGLSATIRFQVGGTSHEKVLAVENRTRKKFALLQKMPGGADLLKLCQRLAGCVLCCFYVSELNGAPVDAAAFQADAACLALICRTLDAVERSDRNGEENLARRSDVKPAKASARV
jgi:hypothetical protein